MPRRAFTLLSMCGITGAFRLDGSRPSGPARARPARDDRRDRVSRARRRGLRLRRRRARSARGGCRSSTSRAATSRSRTRRGRIWARPERRDLQPRRAARRACGRAATCSAAAATPRSSRTCTRSTARRSPSTCAACSPSPSGTRDARRGVLIRDRLGVKPLYYAIVGDRVVFGSELKCVIASGLVDRRARPRGDRRLPDARVRPGADDAARATCASCSPASGW